MVNEDWNKKQLSEILDKEDMKTTYKFLKTQNFEGLREFLRSIKDKLEEKGVLPDYLYYWLELNFKKK